MFMIKINTVLSCQTVPLNNDPYIAENYSRCQRHFSIIPHSWNALHLPWFKFKNKSGSSCYLNIIGKILDLQIAFRVVSSNYEIYSFSKLSLPLTYFAFMKEIFYLFCRELECYFLDCVFLFFFSSVIFVSGLCKYSL